MPLRGRGAELDELREVYELRLNQLRRLAQAIVGDRERALDVVQEGFARAVRQRASFSGEGPLDAWVWRIVLNCARDELAAQRRMEPQIMLEDVLGFEADGPAVHVRTAVSQLPERQRLVLFLRYYADLDYGTIATVLGISVGTVGATLNAGHARMRQLLEEVA